MGTDKTLDIETEMVMDIDNIKGTVAWDWDGLKVIILDGSVLEEEPLVVFKIFKCFFEF